MNKKRIAVFSFHTCPLAFEEGEETGGMNTYVLETSKCLSAKGIKVDVFTRSQDASQPKIVEVNSNLRVIHLHGGQETSIPKKELLEYVPDFVSNFFQFTSKHSLKYDIFDCHYYLSGLAALSIQEKLLPKIAIVMTFHTLALMKNLVARTQEERVNQARIKGERLLIEKSDRIIAPGESDLAYLQYLYNCPKDKISVITPGVNTSLFKPIEKNPAKTKIQADINHKIILFVGRIEPLKGIDVLMYALKILLKRNPGFSVCLWIVGGDVSRCAKLWPEELKKLDILRRELSLETTVKFVGKKTQEELPYYYSAAEIVVVPSHYESFSMVVLEAMACGTPAIATNVSGSSELLDEKHKSLITSSNNPLLLATQIENLMINKTGHKNINLEILKRVKNLTWENSTKKLLDVYNLI